MMTSSMTNNVGNVTKDTDITFEYGVRPDVGMLTKVYGLTSCPLSCLNFAKLSF